MPQRRSQWKDQQRAAWKAQGLTTRGTPRKKIVGMTPEQRRARRMVQARERYRLIAKQAERQNAADRADAERRAKDAHDNDPRVVVFREERERKAQRDAVLMAEAKAIFARALDAAAVEKRGGRPKRKAS
jgi:hypothetical protein